MTGHPNPGAICEEINLKPEETGTPHTGKSRIVLSMEVPLGMEGGLTGAFYVGNFLE